MGAPLIVVNHRRLPIAIDDSVGRGIDRVVPMNRFQNEFCRRRLSSAGRRPVRRRGALQWR
jgi:hypothetical protein